MNIKYEHSSFPGAAGLIASGFSKCLGTALLFMGFYLHPFLFRGLPAHKPLEVEYAAACWLWGSLFLGVYAVGFLIRLLREEEALNPSPEVDGRSRETRDTQ
jgi:hypothetical protein